MTRYRILEVAGELALSPFHDEILTSGDTILHTLEGQVRLAEGRGAY